MFLGSTSPETIMMRLFHDTKGIRERTRRPHGSLPDENLAAAMIENALELTSRLEKYNEV
jgi:hypothetical protein